MSIYDEIIKTGAKTNNHCSDLYCEVTKETSKIVKNYKYKKDVTKFIDNIDKRPWYDIPFAFDPYWNQKAK